MPLPTIATPTYELTLPSTGKKIKYRPFLVKEQKALMIAQESDDEKKNFETTSQLINACTFNKVNAATSPVFDVEYIFIKLRAKSVGEVSKLKLLCPDDKKTYADVELDLNEVKVQVGEDHTNKIELGNGMGLIMKYPTIDSFSEVGAQNITGSNMLDVIGSCILQIYENGGEKVYETKDQTQKEISEFIEQMNTEQFQSVQNFFNTMPKLKHEVSFKNPKTKKMNKVTLTGLNDFFG